MYFLTAWFNYTNDFKDFTLPNGSVNLRAGGRQITRLQISEGQGRLTLFFLLLLLLPVAGRKSTLSPGLILMAHETGLPAEPPDEDVREPGYGSIQNNSSHLAPRIPDRPRWFCGIATPPPKSRGARK
jgi:hypothetical protein